MAKKVEESAAEPAAVETFVPKAPEPVKLEPSEWAKKLGHVIGGNPKLPQSSTHYDAAHACADVLHGWSKHLHHYQSQPLLLTQADYEAALKAAGEYPVTPAHELALSPVKRPKEL